MRRVTVTFLLLGLATAVFAHVPKFLEASDFSAGAYFVEDIALSQIFYYQFGGPETIVFTFLGEPGVKLHILFGTPVGVPSMESTLDFRPKLAIYEPNDSVLADFDFSTAEPELMHEFFGDSYSYLYLRYDSLLSEGGIHKVLLSADQPGRAWITFGLREDFTLAQLLEVPRWISQIREFHYMKGLARWEIYGLAGLAGLAVLSLALIILL